MSAMTPLRWAAAAVTLAAAVSLGVLRGRAHASPRGDAATQGEGTPSARPGDASDAEQQRKAVTFVSFSPTEFPFVTTVKDNGEGKAGRWQVSKPKLEFKRLVIPTGYQTWICTFTIEIPLRTEHMGRIDASRAAVLSAEVAEDAGRNMDFTMPQGIFCQKFVREVEAAFKLKYPLLGARAKI